MSGFLIGTILLGESNLKCLLKEGSLGHIDGSAKCEGTAAKKAT